MKRFFISILAVSLCFLAMGALIDKAGAEFRSDEKALELVRNARIAIGGEAAINTIRSLRIVGQTTRSAKMDGIATAQKGETEIAMQFPDKVKKLIKFPNSDGLGNREGIQNEVNVVLTGPDEAEKEVTVEAAGGNGGIVEGRNIILQKADGTAQELKGADSDRFILQDDENGATQVRRVQLKKIGGAAEGVVAAGDRTVVGQAIDVPATTANRKFIRVTKEARARNDEAAGDNEMLRLALGLLMTPPPGIDVSYTYGGETSVDGSACNVVIADFGGMSYKIFLSEVTNLPLMMSYMASPEPTVVRFRTKDAKGSLEPKADTLVLRRVDGNPLNAVEHSIKFSDYRYVGNVQLPYKWTQSAAGTSDEIFDVTTYDVNPANIGDSFEDQKLKVRVGKPIQNRER